MEAKLFDGPYRGVSLDHNDVNLYTQFVPVGIRKFVDNAAAQRFGTPSAQRPTEERAI